MKTLQNSTLSKLQHAAQTPLDCIERVWQVWHPATNSTSWIIKTEADGYDSGFGFDVPAYHAFAISKLNENLEEAFETPYRTLEEAFDAAQP